jgi:ketosteroid isomerase-like protein
VTTEEAVLAANQRFYDAFSTHDAAAMARVWARDLTVACVHPGWEALYGREAVLASFRAILGDPRAPEVRPSDERVILVGETALVLCIEHVLGAELVATNVLALENSEWKMVAHHASPTAEQRLGTRSSDTTLN